ncbi:MAG: CbtA family protein [Rhizobiaceae bacterium]
MQVFRNTVFCAVIAGLFAGLVLAAMQVYSTVPLIVEAESYEAAAPADDGHSHDHGDAGAGHVHDHGEGWAPADGAERLGYTILTNVVGAIGLALIIVVASELVGGIAGWRQGLLWGFGGFATFVVAPGLGMPPELPAMPAADLGARQSWWIATVLLTGGGLALIAFWRSLPIALLGVALLVAPHLWGAPLPDSFETPVPDALHHRYIVAVTVTNLLFWIVLGLAIAAVRSRFNLGASQPADGIA